MQHRAVGALPAQAGTALAARAAQDELRTMLAFYLDAT